MVEATSVPLWVRVWEAGAGSSAEVLSARGRDRGSSHQLILDKVSELEGLVSRLKDLETEVYRIMVSRDMLMALDRPESEVDLFEVGLQIARLDDPELDMEHYRSVFAQYVAVAEVYRTKTALAVGG